MCLYAIVMAGPQGAIAQERKQQAKQRRCKPQRQQHRQDVPVAANIHIALPASNGCEPCGQQQVRKAEAATSERCTAQQLAGGQASCLQEVAVASNPGYSAGAMAVAATKCTQ